MNKRILHLFNEAGFHFPEMERMGIEAEFNKFAELIVKECASVCESMQLIGPYKEVQDATLKDAVVQIKQHFGVEE
jgi:hypothetical protein